MLNNWRYAHNGTGPRPWFVVRGGYPGGVPFEQYESADGTLIRYGSWEAAQRVADKLNGLNA